MENILINRGYLLMKKRLLLVVCICIISMLAMVGCGSVSSASILLDMAKNTKEVKSVDMNIKMVMDMDTTTDGNTTNAKIDFDMNGKVITDPEVCMIDGKMDMSFLGMNESMNLKSYSAKEEDGSYTSYTYDESKSVWVKINTSIDKEGLGELANFESMNGIFDNFVLSEETTTVNNVNCHKLAGTVEGEDLSKMLGGVESLGSSFGDSIKGLKVNVELYVNAKDMVPVQIKLDFKDSDISSSMGITDGSTVKINEYYITMTYNGINTIDKLEVPEDVKASAVEDTTGLSVE